MYVLLEGTTKEMRFDEFVTRWKVASRAGSDGVADDNEAMLYLASLPINKHFAALQEDIQPLPYPAQEQGLVKTSSTQEISLTIEPSLSMNTTEKSANLWIGNKGQVRYQTSDGHRSSHHSSLISHRSIDISPGDSTASRLVWRRTRDGRVALSLDG